jgi:hypothetical protein
MANAMVGPAETDVLDKRRTQSATANTWPTSSAANYYDIAAMRTRLAAISATAYSTTNLDAMTMNDMIYALRINDDSAGLA